MKTQLHGMPLEIVVAFAVGSTVGALLQVALADYSETDPGMADSLTTFTALILVLILGVGVVGQFVTSRRPKGGFP